MKTLAALVILALALVPVSTAAQATNLTGDWDAKFTLTQGEKSQTISFTFHFTQKGKVLTGTIGPTPERQWKVEKGVVDGAKVTFEVQQPDGPATRTFTLTYEKGRLTGTQKLERAGQTLDIKVEADRAKAK